MPDADNEKEQAWQHTNRGPYIKTASGRRFYLADPQPNDFHLGDIARHLAGINRYTGGSRFTVAQHCVVAAKLAAKFYQSEKMLPARMLIHDADEAYYGDVSSPLKSLLPDYKILEERAQLAIEGFFELTFLGDPLVKEIDYRMWLTERELLFGGKHGPREIDYFGELEPFDYGDRSVRNLFEEWPADEAEQSWLESWRQLFPWMVK